MHSNSDRQHKSNYKIIYGIVAFGKYQQCNWQIHLPDAEPTNHARLNMTTSYLKRKCFKTDNWSCKEYLKVATSCSIIWITTGSKLPSRKCFSCYLQALYCWKRIIICSVISRKKCLKEKDSNATETCNWHCPEKIYPCLPSENEELGSSNAIDK